jgi:hypothetical protein
VASQAAVVDADMMTLGNGAFNAWIRDLAGAANEKDFQSHVGNLSVRWAGSMNTLHSAKELDRPPANLVHP